MTKKYFYLVKFYFLFIQIIYAQVDVKYIGFDFKKVDYKNHYILSFYIENNTNDTLFFSKSNIHYKVKNGETILENKYNVSYLSRTYSELPPQRREFISDNEKKYKAKIYKTAYNRAVKVVKKNNHIFKNYNETDKIYAANVIKDYIYVVPPNDFYVYNINFDNEKLTRHSEVEVKYIKNDYFIGYRTEEYPEGILKW